MRLKYVRRQSSHGCFLQTCIACGNQTYKPGWGCNTCGYVGD